ncbi:MAG: ketoacyl-ACP synthase III [Bacteroidaceae bacterium]|nr:ketoacyl-ACP synthase III [Bacteroidaceae bacterium]MBR4242813.1 ketoacyl-ACP synthase III [Bacteroidaceae bacterium]
MEKIHAIITGVGGYVPEYVLDNEQLSHMIDTSDEWIMARIGVKERRLLNEEGLGTSYMARKAVKQLLEKTNTDPLTVDAVICSTSTPDYQIPSTASIILGKCGMTNAHAFELSAACSGWLFAMDQAACMIESGRYKKIVIVGADKMSSIIDYTDRQTCPIFGDGAGATLVEPTTEDLGWRDSYLRTDGAGLPFLCIKSGGSASPVSSFALEHKLHLLHQEGRTVFKFAVTNMSDAVGRIAERNNLNKDNIDWVIPHQANVRIIDAVAKRLDMPMEKVMINIQHYGNTSSATLPLALWEYEKQLRKGDNLIFTAFGAGFTWGAAYMKWGYDGA